MERMDHEDEGEWEDSSITRRDRDASRSVHSNNYKHKN